jgi:hypothetical protein
MCEFLVHVSNKSVKMTIKTMLSVYWKIIRK